mmetsp:Transcript_2179/g.5143  ORF Transcript_2179/g.5143 Transcript_2179/m.5143 type:complete len:207 (-) Transcript_2179:293-913(-)
MLTLLHQCRRRHRGTSLIGCQGCLLGCAAEQRRHHQHSEPIGYQGGRPGWVATRRSHPGDSIGCQGSLSGLAVSCQDHHYPLRMSWKDVANKTSEHRPLDDTRYAAAAATTSAVVALAAGVVAAVLAAVPFGEDVAFSLFFAETLLCLSSFSVGSGDSGESFRHRAHPGRFEKMELLPTFLHLKASKVAAYQAIPMKVRVCVCVRG